MDVFEAIYGRTSQGVVRPDPVPRTLVEKLLSAAVQAPNHYKVRPWRFVVLTGSGRERLGGAMVDSMRHRFPNISQDALDKTRTLPLRAPVLIAIGVDEPQEPKVIEIENVCAAAAACQNLLLTAHAEGLGAKWRTGEWARDPIVKKFLGFSSNQSVIGFIYLGYPGFQPEKKERPSFEDRVRWFD